MVNQWDVLSTPSSSTSYGTKFRCKKIVEIYRVPAMLVDISLGSFISRFTHCPQRRIQSPLNARPVHICAKVRRRVKLHERKKNREKGERGNIYRRGYYNHLPLVYRSMGFDSLLRGVSLSWLATTRAPVPDCRLIAAAIDEQKIRKIYLWRTRHNSITFTSNGPACIRYLCKAKHVHS